MSLQSPPTICPVCKEKNQFRFIQNHQNKEGNFSLYECGSCNVQFWQPFKSIDAQLYDEGYKNYALKGVIRFKIRRAYHKKFLQLYRNLPRGTKILDLGCGTGEFVAELQKKGYEIWGVDFSENAIEIAKKYFFFKNIYSASFYEFFKKKDLPKFDIITFFEVIEHLDNPLEFIQNVKRSLKPNGRIFLSSPSRERIWVNWNFLDFPPRHLTRWNKEAISNLFQKINFEISYISYIKGQPCKLSEMIIPKFRLGLVNKSKSVFGHYPKLTIFIKIAYFLAHLKDHIIAGILVSPLWAIRKIMKSNKYKEDTMLIELVLKQSKKQ